MAGIATNKAIACSGNISLHITVIEALDEMRLTGGGSHTDPGARGINALQAQFPVCQREAGGGDGQLRRAAHGRGIQPEDVLLRRKIQYLSAEMNAVSAGIEAPHWTKSAPPGHQCIPE